MDYILRGLAGVACGAFVVRHVPPPDDPKHDPRGILVLMAFCAGAYLYLYVIVAAGLYALARVSPSLVGMLSPSRIGHKPTLLENEEIERPPNLVRPPDKQ